MKFLATNRLIPGWNKHFTLFYSWIVAELHLVINQENERIVTPFKVV